MKPSLVKLQKFFKLEAERGYDNHAVLGGLERILDRWESEARLEGVSEDLIQFVIERLRDYQRLTASSRAEVLEGLWRRIQRAETGESAGENEEARKAERSREERKDRARPSASPALSREQPPHPASPAPVSAPPVSAPPVSAPPVSAPPTPAAPASEPPESTPPTPVPQASANATPLPGPEEAYGAQGRSGTQPEDEPAPQVGAASRETSRTDEDQAIPEPIEPGERLAGRPAAEPPAALNAPVTVLPGIGPRHAQTLSRLGLNNLRDMLYNFPRRYDDYSKLKPINRLWYGEEVTVIGTVQSVSVRTIRSGKSQIVEALVSDGSGALRVTWFNQPWIARRLHQGAQIALSGKIEQYLGRLVMNNPEPEELEQQQLSTNRIVPVYPLTAQITQRWLRRFMNQVVTYWAPRVVDPLPAELRREAGLMDLSVALQQAHFPDSWDYLNGARHRLAFDEIFLLQLGMLRQKHAWNERRARTFETDETWLQEQIANLPFSLTGAQQRALQDVQEDLASGRPMNRLLQGDVGSGKTVIAALAIGMLTRHGAQAALMAPTSILAEQHYRNLQRILASQAIPQAEQTPAGAELPPEAETDAQEVTPASPLLEEAQIRLLVGATPEPEKRAIRAGLADGSIKVVIGTHALIEDPVTFKELQLIIVDEQHRFGVEQRAALRLKGDNPHLMVMTATPIPRSLALTVYGDLDLSVMDEMPPGRQAVATYVLPPTERERAYTLIRSQVEKGRQAFIIYPLVEETENSDAKAAVEEYAHLQKNIFPRLRLGLLHGRLRPEEKDEVMAQFRDGQYHILVSTTVVEVGVDVPNASVMLIEGANRFGLAQLHQLRGRVGRGAEKSYCLLIPESSDAVENERLQVMSETNDGFVLAERDLEQRGAGEFLGTRQSGYSELQMANITDVRLIEKARHYAQKLFTQSPDLDRPELQQLAAALDRFWGDGRTDIS